MKTLIVGDLHGAEQIARAALTFTSDYHVVFLGDYLDSYTNTSASSVSTLCTVMMAANTYPDKVSALLGNHEQSYLDGKMRCSGYNRDTAIHMTHLQAHKDFDIFKEFIRKDNWLITHAGVSNRLLEVVDMTMDEYLEAGVFTQIGRVRGGRHTVGGLYWCDWRYEFQPVEGVKQVVGHTHKRGEIRNKGDNYCVDCLPYENLAEADEVKFFILEDEAPLIVPTEEIYERAFQWSQDGGEL